MNVNEVYKFLIELEYGCSYMEKIYVCVENKRNGVWQEETYDAVKHGLNLWWKNKFGFMLYIATLRGLICSA